MKRRKVRWTISQLERGRKNSTPHSTQFGSFPTPLTRPAATLSRSRERGKAARSPLSRTHFIRPSATFSPSGAGKGIEAEREKSLRPLSSLAAISSGSPGATIHKSIRRLRQFSGARLCAQHQPQHVGSFKRLGFNPPSCAFRCLCGWSCGHSRAPLDCGSAGSAALNSSVVKHSARHLNHHGSGTVPAASTWARNSCFGLVGCAARMEQTPASSISAP